MPPQHYFQFELRTANGQLDNIVKDQIFTLALLSKFRCFSCLNLRWTLRHVWFELEVSQIRDYIVGQFLRYNNIPTFTSVKTSGLAILSLVVSPGSTFWRENVQRWCSLPPHCPPYPGYQSQRHFFQRTNWKESAFQSTMVARSVVAFSGGRG